MRELSSAVPVTPGQNAFTSPLRSEPEEKKRVTCLAPGAMAGRGPAADLDEWGSRLNDIGVLKVPAMPKPHRPEPRWIGEPKTADDGWHEYDGFVIGDGESQIRFHIGDAVYLSARCKGKACQIGIILSCIPGSLGDMWMNVQYFKRPTDLNTIYGPRPEFHPSELLLSETRDDNPVDAVELCVARHLCALPTTNTPTNHLAC